MAPADRIFWAFFLCAMAYGIFHISVLTDWIGYAVDEGFTAYGAQRLREGMIPYRDFFFLWTPGILGLHAALQEAGVSAAGERIASLLASAATGALVLRWGVEVGLNKAERILLGLLLLVWGFTLWNIPYSSWFAVCLAAFAVRSGQQQKWLQTGMLFALSFWFKQNVGILAAAGMMLAVIFTQPRPALLRLSGSFFAGIILPFGFFYLVFGMPALAPAMKQIFLFPLTYRNLMAEPLPIKMMAAPIAAFGIWIISLYFFRATPRIKTLAQAAVVVYASVGLMREGRAFYLGSFFLFGIVAWGGSFLAIWLEDKKRRSELLLLWLPLFGAFLQVYPRWDFQHFLFVFPLSAFFLLWLFSRVREKYQWIPGAWIQMPAIFLLLGGGVHQARVNFFHIYGERDPVGFISFGDGHKLNVEMAEVREYLEKLGLPKGGNILVMPNATSFYRFSGFANPTPHDQFFPGYVAAFGRSESNVLAEYERAGGQFIVVQKRSRMEEFAPDLLASLKLNYEPAKDFPVHFSVWKKKPAILPKH